MEKTGLLEGLGEDVNKNNMALMLENQAKQLVVETSQTGTQLLSTLVHLVKTGLESHYH
jgi:hypothetical protein